MRWGLVSLLLVTSFICFDNGSLCLAQDHSQPLMSSSGAQTYKVVETKSAIESQVYMLHLDVYEAAVGDLSACKEDKACLRQAQKIREWKCAADLCRSENQGKNPIGCFDGLSKELSPDKLNQLDLLVCPLLKSSNEDSRKEIVELNSKFNEDNLVESAAYVMAMNDSATTCENYIKEYVGDYGSRWNYKWYRALSGCRILAHQSTVDEEEKDFYVWYGSLINWSCSNIINSGVSLACQTADAAVPRLSQDTSPKEIETLVNELYLKTYAAPSSQTSMCEKDQTCIDLTNRLKPWFCLGYVCAGKDSTKTPSGCFKDASAYYSVVDVSKTDKNICSLLKLLDDTTRQTLSGYISGVQEDDWVEYGAYVLALSQNAVSCQNSIRSYLGEDLFKWNYRWYRALSGCNILAGETSVAQEEAGYYIWYSIAENFNCSMIKNSELRKACEAPGAGSPEIGHEK